MAPRRHHRVRHRSVGRHPLGGRVPLSDSKAAGEENSYDTPKQWFGLHANCRVLVRTGAAIHQVNPPCRRYRSIQSDAVVCMFRRGRIRPSGPAERLGRPAPSDALRPGTRPLMQTTASSTDGRFPRTRVIQASAGRPRRAGLGRNPAALAVVRQSLRRLTARSNRC